MIWVVILLLGIPGIGIVIYNRLVAARNAFRNAFSQIDVQLTRRHDLVPNLVEVARRYLQHEQDTLEAVIAARQAAVSGLRTAADNPGDGNSVRDFASAENALSGALGRLFAVAEAYPELKADRTMMQLSEELVSTENKVAFARQAFNDAVMAYNNLREIFPNNIIAGNFDFTPASQLAIETAEHRKAPAVGFR